MEIFKSVFLRDRKPFDGERYLIRLFGGLLTVRRWSLKRSAFARMDDTVVEKWYKEIQLPSAEDMHFIVDSKIPPGAHEKERELIQKGSRMAVEYLYELIKKA